MDIKTTNLELLKTISFLKKKSSETGSAVWRDLADRLRKPKHRRYAVNISRINRNSKTREKIIVPGKVLGSGKMDHPVHVAAFSFSGKATKKIVDAGGKCFSIPEFVSKNPKGSNLKIIV